MFGGGFGGGLNWNQDGAAPGGTNNADGFGGGAFGGGFPAQSQGLGGFMNQGDGGGQGGGDVSPKNQQGSVQTLTPVTVRMLQDAIKQQQNQPGSAPGGPDAQFLINGRELHMLTLVACVESVQEQAIYKVFKLNDGTGRIETFVYIESAGPAGGEEMRAGDYVRVYGHLRAWGGKERLNSHHIAKVRSSNEISYHGIEVAHVHLSSVGKINKGMSVQPAQGGAGATGFAVGGGVFNSAPPPGGAVGSMSAHGGPPSSQAMFGNGCGGGVQPGHATNSPSPYGAQPCGANQQVFGGAVHPAHGQQCQGQHGCGGQCGGSGFGQPQHLGPYGG